MPMNFFDKLAMPAKVYLGLAVLGFGGSLFLTPLTATSVGVNAVATGAWTALWAYIIDMMYKKGKSTWAWILALVWPILWTVLTVKVAERYAGAGMSMTF